MLVGRPQGTEGSNRVRWIILKTPVELFPVLSCPCTLSSRVSQHTEQWLEGWGATRQLPSAQDSACTRCPEPQHLREAALWCLAGVAWELGGLGVGTGGVPSWADRRGWHQRDKGVKGN